MIKQLNFTTDDGITYMWINPDHLKEDDQCVAYDDATIYYATLEGILDAAKHHYVCKE